MLTFSWRSCSSVFSVTLLGVFGYLWRRSGDYLIVFFKLIKKGIRTQKKRVGMRPLPRHLNQHHQPGFYKSASLVTQPHVRCSLRPELDP